MGWLAGSGQPGVLRCQGAAELRGHPVTRVGQVIAELSPKDTGNGQGEQRASPRAHQATQGDGSGKRGLFSDSQGAGTVPREPGTSPKRALPEQGTYRMMPRGSRASSSSSSEDLPASSPFWHGVGGLSAGSCCWKKSNASPSSPAWLSVSRTETSLLERSPAPGDLVPVEGEGNT